jgi:hypothetical protein
MTLLKKILKVDNKGRRFMNDKDKIKTDDILNYEVSRFCPSLKIPHVFPWQKPVTDEPCHIHTNPLKHYFHHTPFCKLINCPNYESMCKAKKEFIK